MPEYLHATRRRRPPGAVRPRTPAGHQEAHATGMLLAVLRASTLPQAARSHGTAPLLLHDSALAAVLDGRAFRL